jgi:hypothetical protein
MRAQRCNAQVVVLSWACRPVQAPSHQRDRRTCIPAQCDMLASARCRADARLCSTVWHARAGPFTAAEPDAQLPSVLGCHAEPLRPLDAKRCRGRSRLLPHQDGNRMRAGAPQAGPAWLQRGLAEEAQHDDSRQLLFACIQPGLRRRCTVSKGVLTGCGRCTITEPAKAKHVVMCRHASSTT